MILKSCSRRRVGDSQIQIINVVLFYCKPKVQMVLPRGGEQKTRGVRVGAGRLSTHFKKKEAGLLYRQREIYIKNL
jgi:hypothetical protein